METNKELLKKQQANLLNKKKMREAAIKDLEALEKKASIELPALKEYLERN